VVWLSLHVRLSAEFFAGIDRYQLHMDMRDASLDLNTYLALAGNVSWSF